MFLTFTVPKQGANPVFSEVTASLSPPSAFPTMSDVTYNKKVKNVGGGTKLYAFGLPVSDPDGFCVPPELIHLGITSTDDWTAGVPIHTCTAYEWFYGQNPTNVREEPSQHGPILIGEVGTTTILSIPVVMS